MFPRLFCGSDFRRGRGSSASKRRRRRENYNDNENDNSIEVRDVRTPKKAIQTKIQLRNNEK